VVINGDMLSEYSATPPELAETLFLNLSNPVNASLADGQGVGSILDDDSLTISDPVVTEGDAGTTNVDFTVRLAGPLSYPVSVAYATANGTAISGSDYVATSGTLVFAPGETTKVVTVLGLGDRLNEPDETLFLNLSNPVNINLGDAQGMGLIRNDDPLPAISVANVTLSEGNTGTRNATFTVSLSAASGQTVTVAYATADGSASAGSDYVAKSGTLTFGLGIVSQTVTVTVNGDLAVEGDETFFFNLSSPTNAQIGNGQGVAKILNDDGTLGGAQVGNVGATVASSSNSGGSTGLGALQSASTSAGGAASAGKNHEQTTPTVVVDEFWRTMSRFTISTPRRHGITIADLWPAAW